MPTDECGHIHCRCNDNPSETESNLQHTKLCDNYFGDITCNAHNRGWPLRTMMCRDDFGGLFNVVGYIIIMVLI